MVTGNVDGSLRLPDCIQSCTQHLTKVLVKLAVDRTVCIHGLPAPDLKLILQFTRLR